MTGGKASALPGRTGVVGGGTMGAGIAHALLVGGSRVTVVEQTDDAAAAARARVVRSVEASLARGVIEDAAPLIANLAVTTEYGDLRDAALVVEAVPEVLDVKLATLGAVEAVVAPTAVLATNTSSISIGLLAQALAHPERLLGMHFFNPVPASKLVEVVTGRDTSREVVAAAVGWVGLLGKTAVVVRDAPGFASSRLGVALGLEAIRMVEEEVASPEDIDIAMTLGYGHPMGPLRLTDLVGLDVRLGIARYLSDELGPRFAPPQLMIDMVEQGRLGRKSGEGFYRWDS